MEVNTSDIKSILQEFKNELNLSPLASFSPISIENKIFEIDAYSLKTLETRLLRIGSLIFIEIPTNSSTLHEYFIDLVTLKEKIRLLKNKLGKVYAKNASNILFTTPSAYVSSNPNENMIRTLSPIHPYTILSIASLMAYPENFLGKSGIDFGAGDGILTQVALKLGASHVTLIDWNEIQLDKAKMLIEEGALKENLKKYSPPITFLKENLSDKNMLQILQANPFLKNAHFGIANIGPWGHYEGANNATVDIIQKMSQIHFFMLGGYKSNHQEHDLSLLEIQKRLDSNGFNVEYYKYFYKTERNNIFNEKNNSVATIVARKNQE